MVSFWGSINHVSDRYANTTNSVVLTDETYAPWSGISYPDQVALGAPRTEFQATF
jgi:hypothetical protein